MDSVYHPARTPSSSSPTSPPSEILQSMAETPSTPASEIEPGVKDKVEAKKRASRITLTLNACTSCRKRRKKCDGKSPCHSCSDNGTIRSSSLCIYEINARVAKKELQNENSELRRQRALSDQIFHALRSDWQVSNILQLLRDQEALPLIAKIANLPSAESSVGSPPDFKSLAHEEFSPLKSESEDGHGSELATTPSNVLHPWIAASYDEHLVTHLFSLYWTWIHPAYLLFSMERFIEGYNTGNQEHCSAFLVAAICAAACDLLDPRWTSASGKVPDVAALRRDFVAEAIIQETLADRTARTWLDASRVMLIVNSRSEASSPTCSTPAKGVGEGEVG